ncbi:MAG: hypothetical protein JNM17_38235 [Archangium sp.]|nr:hypothetical protein [Archangium sp.]
MGASTARIPSVCATCRKNHYLEVRQEIADGQLKWFEVFACECGHGFETGGAGLPAIGVRKAILGQSGRAEVWIDDAKQVPKVLALLVKGLGVPEADAKKKLAKVPAVAFEGTHAEAAFISMALSQGGVTARVVNHLPQKN